MNLLIYGMQRTGSNYLKTLLTDNLKDLEVCNDGYSRCLPTHKHFRLYDEKAMILWEKYYNPYIYPGFGEFGKHVEELLETPVEHFLVSIKDPFSWYLSFIRHARKNRLTFFRKHVNSHFIIDYNLFYQKWYRFALESPDRVWIVRYEDVLDEPSKFVEEAAERFSLPWSPNEFVAPLKVHMSKRFTPGKRRFYQQKRYLDELGARDKAVISALLDKEVFGSLGYI
jgi:hypothetical protein